MMDLVARQMLEARKKDRREQETLESLKTLSEKMGNIQALLEKSSKTSSAANGATSLNAVVLAYIQQSNKILYTILDQLASSDDIKELIAAVKEIKEVMQTPKEIKEETPVDDTEKK